MQGSEAIRIGGFYELPDGSVARLYGWNGHERLVSYLLDDDAGGRSAPEAEVVTSWKSRPDLRDFPDANDPALPPLFDLLWDAKTRSALLPLLADPDTAAAVSEAMDGHGIVLDEAELATVVAMGAVGGHVRP